MSKKSDLFKKNSQVFFPDQKILRKGILYQQKGKLLEAKKIFDSLIKDFPHSFEINHYLGSVSAQLGQFEYGIELLSKAITLESTHSATYSNLGNALCQLKQFEKAIENYSKAIQISPLDPIFHFNMGNALVEVKRYEDALESFSKAIDLKPDYSGALFNRGDTLIKLNQLEAAIESFNAVIEIEPQSAIAFFNKGNALLSLKQFHAAAANFTMAISLRPDFAEAYHNAGVVMADLRQPDAANISYLKALEINPNLDFLFGTCLHNKMMLCDWSHLAEGLNYYESAIADHKKISLPFAAVTLLDNPNLQFKAAKVFNDTKYPRTKTLGEIKKNKSDGKIRVAYYSADFFKHATSYLIAQLFELHDKDSFEFYGFSFGLNIKDEMQTRVAAAFTKFIDVSTKSSIEVAKLSRELKIDIAIDLKGYTKDNRTEIFALGCAPIQVNYLGYPGTMASDYIQYIIADKILVPENLQSFYSEKIVYLPNSYQVNDSKRKIASKILNKKDFGLPEDGFIFCCFNNNYKITPEVFNTWMRIIKSVDGSVLWLLEDNPTASRNLIREAEARGVSGERLIFGGRLEVDDHLARHQLADLFLDTLPCNAHTTASDALWTGLPVLTCLGNSFAGRVAASLLAALDLQGLITNDLSDYEELAIKLATQPDMLQKIKTELNANKLKKPLFDTKLFAKEIETAYKLIYKRHQEGLEPDHIYVASGLPKEHS